VDDIDRLLEEVADLDALLAVDLTDAPLLARHPALPAARTFVREALELLVRARRHPERAVFRERAAGAVKIAREAAEAAKPVIVWARLRAALKR
jgi:hypothetical protein